MGLRWGGRPEDGCHGDVREARAAELAGAEGDVVGDLVYYLFGGEGGVSPLRTRRRIMEKSARALGAKMLVVCARRALVRYSWTRLLRIQRRDAYRRGWRENNYS